jgi:gluconokinase
MEAGMAFDVGTTHLKWVMADCLSGRIIWEGRTDITASRAGLASEQDPDRVVAMVQGLLQQANTYGHVQIVAFSAAMHSLVIVDTQGRALTKSLTWMDRRSLAVAEQLRNSDAGAVLQRLSGVPVHAMSPLVKWIFLKDQVPGSARPVSLKDYIIFRLTGQWLTDFSTAAASGFLGIDNQWLFPALDMAGLTPQDMPSLVPMATRVASVDAQWQVVIGGSDAALAHRHLGVPRDGSVGVVAMGTSGALRTTVEKALVDSALFCYTMGPDEGYLVGSAFSNVGNLLDWLAGLFGCDVGTLLTEALQAIRSGQPLPLTLAYWFGERSPWWQERLDGAWLHLTPEHGRAELAGSTLLAIAAAYWGGLSAVRANGAALTELRGGSGLLDRPDVAVWMADVLGQAIVLHDDRDASLLGAAELVIPVMASEQTRPRRFEPKDAAMSLRARETWHEVREWMARHELDQG